MIALWITIIVCVTAVTIAAMVTHTMLAVSAGSAVQAIFEAAAENSAQEDENDEMH